MDLYPYQARLIEDLRRAIAAGSRRPLAVAPTGSGKTRTAAAIIQGARDRGKRVLFLAPRRELITQARNAFEAQGIACDQIMAGATHRRGEKVAVASFDTLHARAFRRSSNRMELPKADVVIVDEAHLSVARSRREIIDAYPDAIIIGLTATPARGDGKGLGAIYDSLVVGPSVRELTDAGFLVPARYFAPTKPDLTGVSVSSTGDYVEAELAEAMDRGDLIGDVVENWLRIAPTRRTVVFAVNRAHSRHLMQAFLRQGVTAEHVDGDTPTQERADILARVANGQTQVLCNVFVASYGLDIPVLDCAVLARPTRNIALYLQTVGRVLRIAPGKVDALVIDHAGAISENGFADDDQPWSLCDQTKIKDRKQQQAKEKKEPKQIECVKCATVFSGRKSCPSCGHEMIPPAEDIPVYEADLAEIKRDLAKINRKTAMEDKAAVYAGLLYHADVNNFSRGWAAHQYRKMFGVWPNDKRVRSVFPEPPSPELQAWIKAQAIRYQKGRLKAHSMGASA